MLATGNGSCLQQAESDGNILYKGCDASSLIRSVIVLKQGVGKIGKTTYVAGNANAWNLITILKKQYHD